MTTAFQLVQPRDGDILNRHDGEETAVELSITVHGSAPIERVVTVNGITAERSGGTFHCRVPLQARQNTLAVACGADRREITVFWDRASFPRYRFSIDDNIEFLKDLGLHHEDYPSLFDHWYLAFWREMHREYGAKFHFNIYYQTDGFDLTQMPDKWKEEWQANADWLRLTFHALQDKPDRPYRNAEYPQIAHDFDLITGHIRRFAGEELLSKTTTIHWAECPKPAILALRDRGIENLIGLFSTQGYQGVCTTGYYLSPGQCAYCDTRGAWHDTDTGLNFIRCTSVVNALALEAIPQALDARTATPATAEMVELLIHEQYFRKELHYYQPTILDKVRASLRWVHERSYKPVFWSGGYLGNPQA